MDGDKRKMPTTSPRTFPDMYLGLTPSYTLPATIQQESALRYTLDPASYPRNAACLPPSLAIHSVSRNADTTLEHAREQEALQPEDQRRDSATAENVTTHDGDNDDDDNASVHVDTDDGNDQVYIINAAASSFCGTLPSEDEPNAQTDLPFQAILAMQHLKRARDLAAEQNRIRAAAKAEEPLRQEYEGQSSVSPRPMAALWKKDLMLRTTMRHIKSSLEKGATLTINKTIPQVSSFCCSHPCCPQPNSKIDTDAYYLTLHKVDGTIVHYCLPCLESLWNGEGLTGLHPSPQVLTSEIQQKQALVFSLDGFNNAEWIPQSLLTSKHAPAHLKTPDAPRSPLPRDPTPGTPYVVYDTSPTPVPADLEVLTTQLPVPRRGESPCPSTPRIVEDSPPTSPREHPRSFTTNTGEYLHAPARFQYLAAFITAGSGLSEAEKAAIEAWKTASEDEIFEIEFRERYRRTMEELTVKDDNEDVEFANGIPKCETDATNHQGTVSRTHVNVRPQLSRQKEYEASEDDGTTAGSEPLTPEMLKLQNQCRGQNLSTVLARLSET